jgi:hypothetical protein
VLPKYLLILLSGFVMVAMSGCNHPIVQDETHPSATMSETPAPDPITAEDTWVRIYGNGQESSGGDVIQAEDGGYLIVGGTSPDQESEAYGGVMLLKTDTSGEKLWQKTYGGTGFDAGWAISPAHGGGYILGGVTTSFGAGGRDAYLLKADEEGNELWSKTYGGTLDESISDIGLTEDGGYFLVGNCVDPNDIVADPGSAGYGGFEGRSNVYVVKTDGEGNVIWSHTLESEFNILTVAGIESPQGGYYVLGTKIYFPQKGDDLLLVMLDEDGEEVWTRTWDEGTMGGYTMILDSEGNLIITGLIQLGDESDPNIFLLKVDPLGNQIWQKEFGEDQYYEIGRDVIETKNGDYVLLAEKYTSYYSSKSVPLLISFDKEGQLLWVHELDTTRSLKSGSLIENAQGDYILTGATIDSNGRFSTILIKTDQSGNVSK